MNIRKRLEQKRRRNRKLKEYWNKKNVLLQRTKKIKKLIENQEFSSPLLLSVCMEQLEINPTCYYTHYLLGRHYQDLGIWDRAVEHFKTSILSDYTKLGVWQGLHNSLTSELGHKKGVEKFTTFINRELYQNNGLSSLEDSVLFRVVETKYVDSFMQDKVGRFAPTQNYRKPKSEGPWYDLNENRPHQAIKVENVKMPGVDIQLMELSIGGLYSILCFSFVTRHTLERFLNEYDIEKFQDDKSKQYSVIVINNPKQFVSQVLALHEHMEFGEVYYLPQGVVPRAEGVLCPFIKDESYAEEFEFRFASQAISSKKLNEPVFLDLGAVDSVSEVITPDELIPYVVKKFS
ncbi:hypothetical protein AB4354_01800 [Vibrio splendidus]|uniref:hypothetical protein n=1 Tax=Vibrio splendidus TaxID=29497 RepID=UPI000C848141|nr:hypothetical protein [Vibrio splendidus]PMH03008.1 hypothetical protein BCU75_04995 [Vibrio splendidus]